LRDSTFGMIVGGRYGYMREVKREFVVGQGIILQDDWKRDKALVLT